MISHRNRIRTYAVGCNRWLTDANTLVLGFLWPPSRLSHRGRRRLESDPFLLNSASDKVGPVLKKGKKKQAKGELDRLKQAEKKKRRLEKALATSAAIRSELEKKKQKKIEEQQRLDAEGAAIAESVALHVLVGEDTDEACHFMVKDASKHSPWEYSHNIDHLMGYQGLAKYSGSGLGWATEAHVPAWKCNNWGIGLPLPSQFHLKDLRSSAYDEAGRGADFSAGLEAAQAVASLQIAEDSHGARFDEEIDHFAPNRFSHAGIDPRAIVGIDPGSCTEPNIFVSRIF
ncbi:hypothetical protein OPV22_007929 [Ensete ventricosum]|uniref:G-patch domain-containing protein n=1 Tax=Ensete ventricosum TaxID=4639 RepID=A0AAV8R9X8_ENSVE|nr:hypothetical protein OPV22_007929 [Ensete ventricosum]